MDRIRQAATLPSPPTWDPEALFARLPRLVRSLLVATATPRPYASDAEPVRAAMPPGTALARLLADDAGDQAQRLALLFTDLKDSSSLYQRFGDAAACRIIRAHLEWLERLVQRFGGVIVKTMGDGALAAFGDDAAAVAAALAIQAEIADLNRALGEPGLVLRVGVHAGPCIVTRAAGSFDCFGTTVNLAARVLRMSTGDDITISEAVAKDPTAAALLAEHRCWPATLRGPEAEAIRAFHVSRSQLLARAG
jgi:class 3 adenylate cyclase